MAQTITVKEQFSRLRKYPNLIPLVIGLLLALVAVTYPTFDYDLYWHLANGRESFAQGRIIQEDIFSFTQAGTTYRNTEWLAQLIFYGLWSVGGMLALFLFKLAVTSAVVLLSWRTLTALHTPGWWIAILVPLAVLTGFYRYIERPELFSLFGVAATVAIILCSREGGWPRRVLYVLPFLLAVWEWTHGAVFGMALLAGALVAENLSARCVSSPTIAARADWLATLNRAGLATLALSLVNPYGLLNYGIFAPVITNAAGFSLVQEWAPAGLRQYWLFFVLFAAGLLGLFRRRSPERLTELLWLIGFGVLAWRYSRVTGVFALAALPWLAFAYAQGYATKLQRALFGAALILLSAGLYIHKFSAWSFPERRFGWEVLEDFLPVGSVRFALDQGLEGPLYNTGHFGGYLAFELFPAHRIFQYNLPKVWGETYTYDPALTSRYQINWAIVGDSAELQRMFPRSAWAYLFRDGAGVLAVRRTPANIDLIRRFEVHLFHPNLGVQRLAAGLSNPASGEQLAYEAAVYCAYRRNPSLCPVLVSHLEGQVAYAWRSEWLPKVLQRQSGRKND